MFHREVKYKLKFKVGNGDECEGHSGKKEQENWRHRDCWSKCLFGKVRQVKDKWKYLLSAYNVPKIAVTASMGHII